MHSESILQNMQRLHCLEGYVETQNHEDSLVGYTIQAHFEKNLETLSLWIGALLECSVTDKVSSSQISTWSDWFEKNYLLLITIDGWPIRAWQAPELPAIGQTASVKTIRKIAVLANHVAVLASSQALIGGYIGSYTE